MNLFDHLDVTKDSALDLGAMMDGLFPRGFGISQGNPNF